MRTLGVVKRLFLTVMLIAWCFSFPVSAFAQNMPIERIVTFGTSLSDPGNAFVVLSDPESFGFNAGCNPGVPVNTPPYDALDVLIIPDSAYAKGGHHLSNGATWVEQLARNKGLGGNALPALRDEGVPASNYAIGGARSVDFDCRFNLDDQLNRYLNDFPQTSDATLFILELGGNDIRDALVRLAAGEDIGAIIAAAIIPALSSIGDTVVQLYGHGARQFMLVNVPSVGETPALKILESRFPGAIFAANSLNSVFNAGLIELQNSFQGLPGIEVRMLDLDTLLKGAIADPSPFGIINTDDACVTPNIPPFQCRNPDTYLFWDGIHPTKAVHGFIAIEAAEVLSMPTP
ncbi:MAG: SGNH/GDSL hydrolase family protein [Nitrosomonas sp.]|nr:SGNH/GDSL hydrolase family protein [Nitrosomonas sp.]